MNDRVALIASLAALLSFKSGIRPFYDERIKDAQELLARADKAVAAEQKAQETKAA